MSQDDFVSRLAGLQRAQSELWATLGTVDSQDAREELLNQLSENRAEILALGEARDGTASVPKMSGVIPPELAEDALVADVVEIDLVQDTEASGVEEGEPETPSFFRRHVRAVDNPSARDEGDTDRFTLPTPLEASGDYTYRSSAELEQQRKPRSPFWMPVNEQATNAATQRGSVFRAEEEPVSAKKTNGTVLSLTRLLAVALGLIGLLAIGWYFFSPSDSPISDNTSVAGNNDVEQVRPEIRDVLSGLGYNIEVTGDATTVHLAGSVPSSDDRNIAIATTEALAKNHTVDSSDLVVKRDDTSLAAAANSALVDAGHIEVAVVVENGVARILGTSPEGSDSAAMFQLVGAIDGIVSVIDETESSEAQDILQRELDRIVAATPLIFPSGLTSLTALHERVLNSVAEALGANSDIPVIIVGYSDSSGSATSNEGLSLTRVQNVRDYLGAQGVDASRFTLDAKGEAEASGSEALAGLERRVEFEVGIGDLVTAVPTEGLRIAIVAPSAKNDLAFTQSMFDAANVIASERTDVAVAITESTFIPSEAAVAIRGYAADGYDLVIAHGSEYGGELIKIAPDFPNTVFAWGTAGDTLGLPNVYAYDAAAEEGGYVMGAISTLLSNSEVIGVVGPIEVGDAKRYVDGFGIGARAEAEDTDVRVIYTGSFGDISLAAEAATNHIDAGADILTGSAEMVVGAISVATENNVLWFGTQANQSSLAPDLVVASQVYHWEVLIRQILTDIDSGSVAGRALAANLANGGLVIEFNPSYPLPPEVRDRADVLVAEVTAGEIDFSP